MNPDSEAPKAKYIAPNFKAIEAGKSTLKVGLILNNINILAGSDESRQEAIQMSIKFIGINILNVPELTTQEVRSKITDKEDVVLAGKIELKMDEFTISLVEGSGSKFKERVLLKPLSACIFRKGIYSMVENKCILSDDLQILVSGFVLEATIRDLLKLNVLYSTNMTILKE